MAVGSGKGWEEGPGCRAGGSLNPFQLVFSPAKWPCHIFPVQSVADTAGGGGRESKAAQTSIVVSPTAPGRWIRLAPVCRLQ